METRRDKWLYFLNNLPDLEHIPSIMKEKVFKKAFHLAEFASMPPKEQENYEHDLHSYWTYLVTIETAEKKGKAKGRAGRIAKGMAKGIAKGESGKSCS